MANLSTNSAVNAIATLLGAVEEQSTNGALNLILTAIQEAEGGGGVPYTSYVATLTQTGTNAPVANVLENTITPNIQWIYVSPGRYALATTELGGSPFTTGKTVVFLTFTGTNPIYSFDRVEDPGYPEPQAIMIGVKNNNTDTNVNGVLANAAIEIRVYPA